MTMRICVGASHTPGCHHEQYMAQGVERFLAHPRLRHALVLALSHEAPIDPRRHAEVVLVEMARVAERLDGLQECDTPEVESSLEPVDEDDQHELAGFLAIVLPAADRETFG